MAKYVKCRYCNQDIDARGMRMHEPWCKKQPKAKRGNRPSLRKKGKQSVVKTQILSAPPEEKSLEVQVAELKLAVGYIRDMLMLVTKLLNNLGV